MSPFIGDVTFTVPTFVALLIILVLIVLPLALVAWVIYDVIRADR